MESIAAFLPAILAAPDDDLPRLVCADWLEEHGDPRGEFIRVQCRLANLGEGDGDWPTLRSREHALRSRYEKTWVAPLKGLVRAWEFRRGFVEQISIEAGTFVSRAAELFALAPVRHVHFLDAAPVIAQLANCPQLAHLNAIQLNSTYINDENVRQLAASPYLSQVAMLHLGKNNITDRGVIALSVAVLDHLEMLRLDHNAIGPEGAEALARATHWTRLNALDLFRNFIGDRGASAFLGSPFPALTSLRTSFNGIAPEFQAALQEKFPRPFPLQ